jgi:uncharacterized protein YegL
MQDILELHDAVNYRYLKSNSCGTVFIAIEMRSLKPPEDSIIRLSDLSLVMDCSSSMQGEKFKQAKKSALQLFELLDDDYYYLSVISFDKSARVALGSTKKSESKSAEQDVIRNLKLGKGTNIYEGLELAFKEISDKPEVYDSSSNNSVRPRRIVLLTDGQASVGKIKEADFIDLSKRIRQQDITVSTIGIGDKYDQELLQAIAETGGGLPYHVKEINELQNIFSEQADELTRTIQINPTLTITLMPGAQIQDIYMVTPTLQKLGINKSSISGGSNHYTARLRDIIVGQRQTIALRVNLPERTSGVYRLARIEVNNLMKNIEVEYTDDILLYSKETDPYPRMILTCSEATGLVNKGIKIGDHETIRKAEALLSVLSQDKDFERISIKRPILNKMASTISAIIKRISQGPLTESEKKEALHATMVSFK